MKPTEDESGYYVLRSNLKVAYVRKPAKPEECHTRIYNALDLPIRPGKTSKIIL